MSAFIISNPYIVALIPVFHPVFEPLEHLPDFFLAFQDYTKRFGCSIGEVCNQ